jgi:hypothetical protein
MQQTKDMREAERAELIQSLKAFLIPSSMFLATVISAGGVFLVYNGYALGYGFIAVAVVIIVTALVAFVRFQNKLRAAGRFQEEE